MRTVSNYIFMLILSVLTSGIMTQERIFCLLICEKDSINILKVTNAKKKSCDTFLFNKATKYMSIG